MTHIQSDIRSDSTKFLTWTLDVGGPEIVRGSWTKVLSSYAGLLGWTLGSGEKTKIQLARGTSIVGNVNVTARHVATLYTLLHTGLSETPADTRRSRPKTMNYISVKSMSLQHPLIQCYLLPTHSAPFGHLNLFSSTQTDSQTSSHDIQSRRTQFEQYVRPLLQYLHDLSAELVPSNMSRQPNQTTVDDLRVTIVKLLSLMKEAYHEDEEVKRPWHKEWKQCLNKMSSMVEGRTRSEGSRRLV